MTLYGVPGTPSRLQYRQNGVGCRSWEDARLRRRRQVGEAVVLEAARVEGVGQVPARVLRDKGPEPLHQALRDVGRLRCVRMRGRRSQELPRAPVPMPRGRGLPVQPR